jgi:carbamoyltransferase
MAQNERERALAMSPNIIGIAAHYHDSACCLMRDGRLIAAAQEERFTRIKHDASIPRHAFRYCLQEGDLTIADVDCIAYYEDPRKKLARHLWMAMLPDLSPDRRASLARRLDCERPLREIREVLGFDGRIEIVEHHHAHAASSFYFSGFADAALLTVDGVGEWATTTYGRGGGAGLEIFEEVHFPHSLGLLYSAVTAYLGFEVNEGEYKVMGLAPYGQPKHVAEMRKLIEMGAEGQYRLALPYFDFLRFDRMFSDEMPKLFGEPSRTPESAILPFHKDVARSLQVVLEETLLEKVRYLHDKVSSRNLCMAGGVALNCVANSRIIRDGPFANLFVQPAASDAGSALGAAAIAHTRLVNEAPIREPLGHVYLGPRYGNDEIHQLLDASSLAFQDFRGKESDLIRAVVDRLAAGDVIGWFWGRMEFGPRSLGARSILADPRNAAMRDRINALVKKREAFRPFAPVVLAPRAKDHFVLDHPSPFMLEVVQVRSPLDLPAITHVDGSARVQTVDEATNPRLARLLEEFHQRTQCPILLNTSFNMRGEPIVCTPSDALLCFVNSDLDVLVLEDFVINRSSIPAMWKVFATTMAAGWRDAVDRGTTSDLPTTVYTFV